MDPRDLGEETLLGLAKAHGRLVRKGQIFSVGACLGEVERARGRGWEMGEGFLQGRWLRQWAVGSKKMVVVELGVVAYAGVVVVG